MDHFQHEPAANRSKCYTLWMLDVQYDVAILWVAMHTATELHWMVCFYSDHASTRCYLLILS